MTGGTIDVARIGDGNQYYFEQSHIPQLLERVNCTLPITTETLFLKDSIYTTDADRQLIFERCQAVTETHIVITHGTDSMVETAQLLAAKPLEKTIVLTGAFIPSIEENSDALFNLGTAVAFVQCLQTGVYISMNGMVFDWYNVIKNHALKSFMNISK